MSNEITTLFVIAGIGFMTAIFHTILKQSGKEEFAHWVTLTGIVIVLVSVLSYIDDLFEKVRNVFMIH
jgi:stage III sporulation protein AC